MHTTAYFVRSFHDNCNSYFSFNATTIFTSEYNGPFVSPVLSRCLVNRCSLMQMSPSPQKKAKQLPWTTIILNFTHRTGCSVWEVRYRTNRELCIQNMLFLWAGDKRMPKKFLLFLFCLIHHSDGISCFVSRRTMDDLAKCEINSFQNIACFPCRK